MIVGLGNPGESYTCTRHNVGFRVVDHVAELVHGSFSRPLFGSFLLGRGICNDAPLILVKPLTFMNRSGLPIPGLLKRFSIDIDRLLVVCDTLDLETGVCRLKRRGGSAGHKGIASIIDVLGSGEFPRIYVGIGRPKERDQVIDYVLGTPAPEEAVSLDEAEKTAARAIVRICHEPIDRVMHDLNRTKNSESS